MSIIKRRGEHLINMEAVSLNGVKVYPYNSAQQLLKYIDVHKGILVAINADKILHATDQTRAIINRNIGYCDGVGAMLALRKKGYKDSCKIPGCELWLKIVDAYHKKKSFYLVGARPEVINETVSKLRQEFKGIRIVGYRDGYIRTNEERLKLIEDVEKKKPDVIFVAMGSPKQELLMEEMQRRHNAIYQGLGGSFDVYTGHVKRAPQWWIDHNLEGAYRLFKQPYKIKRYIKALPFWINLYLNKY